MVVCLVLFWFNGALDRRYYVSFIPQQYKIDCKVTVELLDTESDETEKCVSNAQTWNNYVEGLSNPMASMSSATRTGDSNNLAKIEIKTEKSDDDVVSV